MIKVYFGGGTLTEILEYFWVLIECSGLFLMVFADHVVLSIKPGFDVRQAPHSTIISPAFGQILFLTWFQGAQILVEEKYLGPRHGFKIFEGKRVISNKT